MLKAKRHRENYKSSKRKQNTTFKINSEFVIRNNEDKKVKENIFKMNKITKTTKKL